MIYRIQKFLVTGFKVLSLSIFISAILTISYVLLAEQSQSNDLVKSVSAQKKDHEDNNKQVDIELTQNIQLNLEGIGIGNLKKDYIDYRAIVFDIYLESENSPLAGMGETIVDICEKHSAPKDCTAILGIAKYETNLCKYGPSQDQKNCWGFGGAAGNRYYFNSYENGMDVVMYRLVNYYGIAFLEDPRIAEMTYCGPRPSCRLWGDNVVSEMNRINQIAIDLGYPSLYSLREN